jgi:hypothetical protein
MIAVLLTGLGTAIVIKVPENEWVGWIVLFLAGIALVKVEDEKN